MTRSQTRVIATYRCDQYSHYPYARLTIESAHVNDAREAHSSTVHSAALAIARHVWGEDADIIKVSARYFRTVYEVIYKSSLKPAGKYVPRNGHVLYAKFIVDGSAGAWDIRESESV